MVDLKQYRVSSIEFENKVPNGTQLKLKNQFSYNIDYMDKEKRCVARLDFRVNDEEMNPFEIRVQMEAVFTFDEGDDKADIHVTTFDHIFPFLRQIVSNITSMSGMPGLMIPIMKLDKSKVKVAAPDDAPESSPLN